MEADGHKGAKNLGKLFSLYEREAAGIRDELIRSCARDGSSYILLEIDGGDEVFELSFTPSEEYDIITAFRTDSPVDSAKFACGVRCAKAQTDNPYKNWVGESLTIFSLDYFLNKAAEVFFNS